MSKREDINGNRLIYTENLGWIDLGYANGIGAMGLINNIKNEGKGTLWEYHPELFVIEYSQQMAKNFLTSGVITYWVIKKGLSEIERKAVALSIFMYASIKFENHQDSIPQSFFLDSGFSCEDLVSNLLGFYKIAEPNNYNFLMRPYSKEYSYKIWDHYGDVGKYKVRDFKILYFPDPDKNPYATPYYKPLPTWLCKIPILDVFNSKLFKKFYASDLYQLNIGNVKLKVIL